MKNMKKRPTSPHLSIYKWQITSVLSILHRFTGVALFISTLIFAVVFSVGVSNTTVSYDGVIAMYNCFLDSLHSCYTLKTISGLVLFGLLFSFIYHSLNGIRYLIWSFGIGFDLKFVTITAYLILVISFVASIVISIFAIL